jgi:uncharacterized protein (UPF0297 family)/uncharacterized protein YwbE
VNDIYKIYEESKSSRIKSIQESRRNNMYLVPNHSGYNPVGMKIVYYLASRDDVYFHREGFYRTSRSIGYREAAILRRAISQVKGEDWIITFCDDGETKDFRTSIEKILFKTLGLSSDGIREDGYQTEDGEPLRNRIKKAIKYGYLTRAFMEEAKLTQGLVDYVLNSSEGIPKDIYEEVRAGLDRIEYLFSSTIFSIAEMLKNSYRVMSLDTQI